MAKKISKTAIAVQRARSRSTAQLTKIGSQLAKQRAKTRKMRQAHGDDLMRQGFISIGMGATAGLIHGTITQTLADDDGMIEVPIWGKRVPVAAPMLAVAVAGAVADIPGALEAVPGCAALLASDVAQYAANAWMNEDSSSIGE